MSDLSLLTIPQELLSMILSPLDSSTLFSLNLTTKKYVSNKSIRSARVEYRRYIVNNLRLSFGSIRFFGCFYDIGCRIQRGKLSRRIIHFDAIINGYTNLFKWLVRPNEVSSVTDWHYTTKASQYGLLEILKYLRTNGCWFGDNSCKLAAANGHLDVLKYLHENGNYEWDKEECWCAAGNGHIKILQYLHENKCPWDLITCMKAAAGGHMESLQYLHDNGCPCKEVNCEYCKNKS